MRMFWAKEASKSFQKSAFQIEVGIIESSHQKRKTCDKAHGSLCVAIHQSRHVVKLAFSKQEDVTASREKGINPRATSRRLLALTLAERVEPPSSKSSR